MKEQLEHPILAEIRRWQKSRDRFFDIAKKAEVLYAGDTYSSLVERPAQLNIFWSIVNTLKPALYGQAPVPEISRRYPERNIEARLGAQVLERCVSFQLDTNNFDESVSKAVDDYLVAGQGSVWLRYEPVIGTETQRIEVQQQIDPTTQQPIYIDIGGVPVDVESVKQDTAGFYVDGEQIELLIDEKISVDYVHWSDLLFEPARTWAQVNRVARRVHITKDEFKQKFGEDTYIGYSTAKEQSLDDVEKEVNHDKICVFEVWCKDEKKVYWLADGYSKILKEDDPYLKFDNFFPCPEPLFTTLTNGLIPKPDICFYQDQQETLNQLCQKAQDIARYIKVLSIGGSENPELNNLLRKPNGTHIELANFQMYLQNGGVKNSFEVLSMADHSAILRVLHEAIEQEKQQIYDITGIADIVRGVSSASETYGAQQIKSQYAMSRISSRQQKVAKFCRDIIRLMCDIVKNHFQPHTMLRMAGVGSDPEVQQYMSGVIDLLKNDTLSDYKIDVETDSTTFSNTERAKQSAIELTNALGNLFNILLPYAQTVPQLVPVINDLTLYTTSQFEAGRDIKGKLEKAFTEVEEEIQRQRQQAEMQAQQQAEAEQQAQQAEAQPEAQEAPQEPQVDPRLIEIQQKQQQAEAELQLKIVKMKSDEELKRQEILLADERERRAEDLKHQREQIKLQIDKAATIEKITSKPTRRTGKIVPDGMGGKMLMIEEQEEFMPEVFSPDTKVEGITVKKRRRSGRIVPDGMGGKTIIINDEELD